MITEAKMNNEVIEDAVSLLNELREDATVPRNIKTKIEGIVKVLQEGTETSIKVNKALTELEEVADDANLQPYSRTQVWNVVSLLEKA